MSNDSTTFILGLLVGEDGQQSIKSKFVSPVPFKRSKTKTADDLFRLTNDDDNTMKVCSSCNEEKPKIDFSKRQWLKETDDRRCKGCVTGGSSIVQNKENIKTMKEVGVAVDNNKATTKTDKKNVDSQDKKAQNSKVKRKPLSARNNTSAVSPTRRRSKEKTVESMGRNNSTTNFSIGSTRSRKVQLTPLRDAKRARRNDIPKSISSDDEDWKELLHMLSSQPSPPKKAMMIANEPHHFDVAQNTYGCLKDMWAFGTTVPVVSNALGLTEAIAAILIKAVIKKELTAIDQDGIVPNMKKLDDEFVTPIISWVWNVIAPVLGA